MRLTMSKTERRAKRHAAVELLIVMSHRKRPRDSGQTQPALDCDGHLLGADDPIEGELTCQKAIMTAQPNEPIDHPRRRLFGAATVSLAALPPSSAKPATRNTCMISTS
jgi:hypothetical protein